MITSGATVMVAVFSTFATLSVVSMTQLGVGLAVAIVLDSTINRGLRRPSPPEVRHEPQPSPHAGGAPAQPEAA